MDRIPSPPDPSILARNLDVLRAVQPELSAALSNLDLTDFRPTPARTRDGQVSFRLTRPDGQTGWLGRTSIPTVRAAVLMEQFDPGPAHVLLPGFGEGTEAGLLLGRIKPHQAVYVWEPDLVTIRLVLALKDFAAAMSNLRLVLLHCPAGQLTQSLVDWVARHPGHQCPSRLMMWPWQTPAEIDACRASVEAAWQLLASRG